MKVQIHPDWYPKAKVTCSCGNEFTVGATVPEIRVEVCYKCHPFYTGTMKFLDAAGRVDSFKARVSGARNHISKGEKRKIKKEKRLAEEAERPTTLSELRSHM